MIGANARAGPPTAHHVVISSNIGSYGPLMDAALTVILLVAWFVTGITGLVSWFASAFYAIKMMRRTQYGVRLRSPGTLWNPANILLPPDSLTPDGMVYRRKCIVASAVFLASVATGFVIALLFERLN